MTSEIRVDPFTCTPIFLATHRRTLVPKSTVTLPAISREKCPFCPGHEAETETTIEQYPATGPWSVRVVRNRFPLVTEPFQAHGQYQHLMIPLPGGEHELVIECTDHDLDLPDFSAHQTRTVMCAIQSRVKALIATPNCESIFVFRNRGTRAGSSQPHAHTQIVGLSFIPNDLEIRRGRATTSWVHGDLNIFDDNVAKEIVESKRLIETSENFVAFCPYASRKSFEVRVAPRPGALPFDEISPANLDEFSDVLHRALVRMRNLLGAFDYNLVWRLPPNYDRKDPSSGWHLDILPRIFGNGAGFELGSGCEVLLIAPEDAAEQLRAATTPLSQP